MAIPDDFVPAVAFLKIDDAGRPRLAGTRCAHCGVTLVGDREACASCGRRDALEAITLGRHGKLYCYTIVNRSFPGVPTPFVSAVVDLDDGGSLGGTLFGVEPALDHLAYDMPVEVVFRDSGQKDAEGRPFLAYGFAPAGSAR